MGRVVSRQIHPGGLKKGHHIEKIEKHWADRNGDAAFSGDTLNNGMLFIFADEWAN